MRLIDADKLLERISADGAVMMSYTDSMTKEQIADEAINSAKACIVAYIKDAPTVEVLRQPEIVRCKDCRYWHRIKISGIDDNNFYGKCRVLIFNSETTTTAYWFCADGERRTDEQDSE